jgi:hypothetical protein
MYNESWPPFEVPTFVEWPANRKMPDLHLVARRVQRAMVTVRVRAGCSSRELTHAIYELALPWVPSHYRCDHSEVFRFMADGERIAVVRSTLQELHRGERLDYGLDFE